MTNHLSQMEYPLDTSCILNLFLALLYIECVRQLSFHLLYKLVQWQVNTPHEPTFLSRHDSNEFHDIFSTHLTPPYTDSPEESGPAPRLFFYYISLDLISMRIVA